MAETEGQDEALTVEIVIEDERWEDAGLPALAERAACATLDFLDRRDSTLVVLGCDDARIAELNASFRGKAKATNVLSWPAVAPIPRAPGATPLVPREDELGDIAIAWETCAAEAEAQRKPFNDHIVHLLVHAILHLAGYDHDLDADAETMEQAERSILSGLGISDPYFDRGTE